MKTIFNFVKRVVGSIVNVDNYACRITYNAWIDPEKQA